MQYSSQFRSTSQSYFPRIRSPQSKSWNNASNHMHRISKSSQQAFHKIFDSIGYLLIRCFDYLYQCVAQDNSLKDAMNEYLDKLYQWVYNHREITMVILMAIFYTLFWPAEVLEEIEKQNMKDWSNFRPGHIIETTDKRIYDESDIKFQNKNYSSLRYTKRDETIENPTQNETLESIKVTMPIRQQTNPVLIPQNQQISSQSELLEYFKRECRIQSQREVCTLEQEQKYIKLTQKLVQDQYHFQRQDQQQNAKLQEQFLLKLKQEKQKGITQDLSNKFQNRLQHYQVLSRIPLEAIQIAMFSSVIQCLIDDIYICSYFRTTYWARFYDPYGGLDDMIEGQGQYEWEAINTFLTVGKKVELPQDYQEPQPNYLLEQVPLKGSQTSHQLMNVKVIELEFPYDIKNQRVQFYGLIYTTRLWEGQKRLLKIKLGHIDINPTQEELEKGQNIKREFYCQRETCIDGYSFVFIVFYDTSTSLRLNAVRVFGVDDLKVQNRYIAIQKEKQMEEDKLMMEEKKRRDKFKQALD